MKRKVALVTGAASGIGKAVSQTLSERYAVAMNDIDEEELEKTASEISQDDVEVVTVPGDVSDSEMVDSIVETTAERLGRIDVLVNNAGIETVHEFINLPEEDWDRVMDTNLKAQYLLSKRVANHMIRNGIQGDIVNISSVHDTIPRREKVHYDTSKAGVHMLTKDMTLELAEYGINVNCVAPGVINTQMNPDLDKSESLLKDMRERIPWGRVGEPEDVSDVVDFLVSEKAEYLTGVRIPVDGGLSLDP